VPKWGLYLYFRWQGCVAHIRAVGINELRDLEKQNSRSCTLLLFVAMHAGQSQVSIA